MGGDRGHAVLAPFLRGQHLPLSSVLPPQDRGAQQAAPRQIFAYPWFDGAEVLPHHQCWGAMRLQGKDPNQRLVVVADVGACAGLEPLRHPPQSEQTDDVVDPEPAHTVQGGPHHGTERLVLQFLQFQRVPRGLSPILTTLVVLIRWSADGDPGCIDISHQPGFRAGLADSDSQIGQHTHPHTGFFRSGLRR